MQTTAKFQILNRAYAVLSDKQKRAIYDETGKLVFLSSFFIVLFSLVSQTFPFVIGIVDDEICTDDVDWLARWRLIFRKITKEDIDNFIRKFRGFIKVLCHYFFSIIVGRLTEKSLLTKQN